jgi:hypothetical protein
VTRTLYRLAATTHTAAHTAVQAAQRRGGGRRDRGDVPGWVLITVMTAGLVSAIWLLAGPALTSMFQEALAKVTGK